MTVTHVQLLLRDACELNRQTHRKTDREKESACLKLIQRCQGFSTLLKFHCIEMRLIPSALSWDRAEVQIFSL